jgi:hypothetical protein
MVLSEPVEKRGSEVTDSSVMTSAEEAAISMRRLQGIAPRAALSSYKEATMGKPGEKRERRSAILEPDAAGIDIGAEAIYIAVPPDHDEHATRRFSSFTCDLYAWPSGWSVVASGR